MKESSIQRIVGSQKRFPTNNIDFNNNIVVSNIIGNPSEDTTSSNSYKKLENRHFTENFMPNGSPDVNSSLNFYEDNYNSHDLVPRK